MDQLYVKNHFTNKYGSLTRLTLFLSVMLLLGCAGCSTEKCLTPAGSIREEWAAPGVGTVTNLLAADVWEGPQTELVALAGGNLHVFTGPPEGYASIFQTREDPMAAGWHGGRLLSADFDRDGKAEIVRSGKGRLSLYFAHRDTFRELVIKEGVYISELRAGRFLSGRRPGLAVNAGDSVYIFRIDLLSRKVRETARIPLPEVQGQSPGWLAVLPAVAGAGESLLLPGPDGQVLVFREGTPLREVNLGQGRIINLQVVSGKDKKGPLLLAHYDHRAELYRWNRGKPERLWVVEHGGNSRAYPVDLDRDGNDELVFVEPAYDPAAHRYKGSILVYGLAGGQPRLLWDSGDLGALRAAFGDLDGDGRAEIVAGAEAGFRCPDTPRGKILVFTSRDRGLTEWSEVWQSQVYEEGDLVFAVADTDRDGTGELYAGNSGNCDNKGTFRRFRAGVL